MMPQVVLHAMQWLETKIPPPIVMLLMGIVAFAVAHLFPTLSFGIPLRTFAASTLVLVGVALNLLPKLAFRRAGTTVNPLKPASTNTLVTSGIYRHTRNPMYLGQCVILMGWVVYLHNIAAFAAVPAFMLYITRFQILPEKRLLSARFPEEYAAFRKQVSRWL